MQSTNDSLLDLLNNVGDEVKSISKRVEHTTVKSKEEVANYIELINKLIRELDHTVEKLESMKS
jgi:uncharacterized protein Yka (UPF0111/DUF47 family)